MWDNSMQNASNGCQYIKSKKKLFDVNTTTHI